MIFAHIAGLSDNLKFKLTDAFVNSDYIFHLTYNHFHHFPLELMKKMRSFDFTINYFWIFNYLVSSVSFISSVLRHHSISQISTWILQSRGVRKSSKYQFFLKDLCEALFLISQSNHQKFSKVKYSKLFFFHFLLMMFLISLCSNNLILHL